MTGPARDDGANDAGRGHGGASVSRRFLIRDACRAAEGFDPGRSVRHLSIGMSDDFELAAGPAISRLLLWQAPGLSLVFRQTNQHTVARMLDQAEIDCTVAVAAARRSWSVQEEIGVGRYACL